MKNSIIERRLNRLENETTRTGGYVQLVFTTSGYWLVPKANRQFDNVQNAINFIKDKYKARRITVDDTRRNLRAMTTPQLKRVIAAGESDEPAAEDDAALAEAVKPSADYSAIKKDNPDVAFTRNYFDFDKYLNDLKFR